jgi:ketosteroid isomerase-like protein
VSAEDVRVIERIQTSITDGDVVAALDSHEADLDIRRLFMELAEPDFETTMVGPAYTSARLEYTGFEGFAEAWREWTSPFESYKIEVEQMIDAGEQVVSLVEMSGKTRTGGAEITAPGAAVWTLVDSRVRKVEFHIDRNVALRAAGLEPETPN